LQNSEKVDKAFEYVENRFGVEKEDIEGLGFREVSGDVWVSSSEDSGLEAETYGIRAIRFMDIGLKPTTYFLQLLGEKIKHNDVRVDEKEFKTLLQGDMIERKMDEKGYVAIVYDSRVFGCGFYMDELVSSRVPEGRAKELLNTL